MVFFKKNIVFIITLFATLLAIIWLVIVPDFEPGITALLGIVASFGLMPKDWTIIQKKSIKELPKFSQINLADEITICSKEVEVSDEMGNIRFYWDGMTNNYPDTSLQFEINKPKFFTSDFSIIPIRLVMSMLVNSYSNNQFFIYAYIPDRPPVCFYNFQANTARLTVVDIDDDGIPELVLGFKCGAHSEGIRFFKLDKELNFNYIEGSDIGSDFPLITWKKSLSSFEVRSYSRNWGSDREKWHDRYEKFVFNDFKFELESTSKIKWKNN